MLPAFQLIVPEEPAFMVINALPPPPAKALSEPLTLMVLLAFLYLHSMDVLNNLQQLKQPFSH